MPRQKKVYNNYTPTLEEVVQRAVNKAIATFQKDMANLKASVSHVILFW